LRRVKTLLVVVEVKGVLAQAGGVGALEELQLQPRLDETLR
jgi:hypothetical protein